MVGWKFELFDCQENYFMFFWSLCVPCGYHCMQMLNAKQAEPNNRHASLRAYSLVLFLGCLGGSLNRHMLRQSMKIEDNSIWDFIHCLVPCCAVTQEWMHVMSIQKGNSKLKITELKVNRI
ncbi:unnamed protein product [Blepharisma stoltei]|uniref:Uncharacterized protein n=1 Tax=Blepharisma stoltei TaxID=1481888 RepID=A0AAU9KCY0_9CILI|nr:unnamed protein product [Blepharisma stoltei]